MEVYVVTDGDYSAFHICGIYSTLALATEARKVFGAANEIEIWKLNHIPEHPVGMYGWVVSMDRNGTVGYYERAADNNDDKSGLTFSTPKVGVFHMWARNKRHAVKIANERRVQMIAAGQWPPDCIIRPGQTLAQWEAEQDARRP